MFNKLGARIYQWLSKCHNNLDQSEVMLDKSYNQAHLSAKELCHLSIYSGIGGKILEFRHNDPKKDEYDYNLYLIPDDEDFAPSAGKIIMMEILKSR